jgi:hypothetical protein
MVLIALNKSKIKMKKIILLSVKLQQSISFVMSILCTLRMQIRTVIQSKLFQNGDSWVTMSVLWS